MHIYLKIISLIGGITLLYILSTQISFEQIRQIASTHQILGAVLLGIVMCSTTIIAPLSSLPLVPLVAPILGPFTTGVASYVGWVLGAIGAFWIGRHYGQPVVARLLGEKILKRYSSYTDTHKSFVVLVLLRMVFPVDALSYLLGIGTTISWPTYILSTMIGVFWFSFSLAYLGDALVHEYYVLLSCLSVVSVFIFGIAWWYIIRKTKTKE